MLVYSKLYITIKSFPSKISCHVYIYVGLLKTLHHNQKFPIQNIVSCIHLCWFTQNFTSQSKVSHPKYRVVYTFMLVYSKLYITIKSFPSKISCRVYIYVGLLKTLHHNQKFPIQNIVSCIHLCWFTQNFTSQSKVSHPKYRVVYTFMLVYSKLYITIKSFPSKISCHVYIYVGLLKTLHHNQKFPIQNIVSCIHLCWFTQNFTSQSKVSHPKYLVSVYIYVGLLKTLHHNQKFPIQNILSVYTFMLVYSKLYITIKSFPSKISCQCIHLCIYDTQNFTHSAWLASATPWSLLIQQTQTWDSWDAWDLQVMIE